MLGSAMHSSFLPNSWRNWCCCIHDCSPAPVSLFLPRSTIPYGKVMKVRKRMAVCATSTTPLRELTCHMGSHSITCHPAEVTFPPLPQPIKAGTRFSNHRGMQGWVDLVGLVTYRGGIPARRRSPIPALNGLNVEQPRSCDKRRYHKKVHNAKPPTIWYISSHSSEAWLQTAILCLLYSTSHI